MQVLSRTAERRVPQRDTAVKDTDNLNLGTHSAFPKSRQLCKFFAEGFCVNEENCRYVHSLEEVDLNAGEHISPDLELFSTLAFSLYRTFVAELEHRTIRLNFRRPRYCVWNI